MNKIISGFPVFPDICAKSRYRGKGFTLIEVMIVVAIVAILAVIAYPSYQNYIRKAKRADAKASMLRVQFEEEKWRTNHTGYTATLSSLGFSSSTSAEGLYTISVTEPDGTTYTSDGVGYTVKAVAVSGTTQAKDTGCTTMYLRAGDHISNANPEKSPPQCW